MEVRSIMTRKLQQHAPVILITPRPPLQKHWFWTSARDQVGEEKRGLAAVDVPSQGNRPLMPRSALPYLVQTPPPTDCHSRSASSLGPVTILH
ncbi:hypothetical protein R1flu_017385 [Riccia fluitans]|uniref:Uncharacterized protein n=1 Tax=Riccia fluitans TaxID=41844 RepID=A0ABD1ZD03_9MARC